MELPEMVGLAAAFCTTAAFVPQVWKSHSTKRTNDLSWGLLALSSTGVSLWLLYGLSISNLPLIAANVATLALLLTLVYLKHKYG